MTDMEMLSCRVLKLEARLRWMYRAAIVVGMLVTAGAVVAQVKGPFVPGEVLPNGRLVTPGQKIENALIIPLKKQGHLLQIAVFYGLHCHLICHQIALFFY